MLCLVAQHAPFTFQSRLQHVKRHFRWFGPKGYRQETARSGGRAGQRSTKPLMDEVEEDREGVESEASVGEFFDAKGTFAADIFAKYVLSLQRTALQSK